MPQQTGPVSVFCTRGRRSKKREKEEGAGWITEELRASVSFFLFILLVCFFFSSSLTPPPPPPLMLISSPHLQHTFALPSFNFSPPSPSPPSPSSSSSFSSSSLFSSLCLPREKRFCLLLVSAPSQSAFLISSYCFCLIFKCYPGPNGNPYKKKRGVREGERNRLGIVFHSRTPRQKPPPLGKDLEGF